MCAEKLSAEIVQHFYRARLISIVTTGLIESDGKLEIKTLFYNWDELENLAEHKTSDIDVVKGLVIDFHQNRKKLDDWWMRRSKLGQRIYPFRTVKIPVLGQPRRVTDGIVSLHKKVRKNFGPHNAQLSAEDNIIIARWIDKLKSLQDDGGD